MRKCINCAWQGKKEETITKEDLPDVCPVCGNNTLDTPDLLKEEPTESLGPDLDGDGDFDSDDVSLGAKALVKGKKLLKGRKKR